MANDTLLQLVDQAAGEMGLDVPPSVVGSSVQQTQQYLYLMNGKGRQLAREFEWNAAQVEYRFTTAYTNTVGDVVNGSPIVTNIPSTVGLVANNWQAIGAGINQDTYILSVDSPTQVTLTQNSIQTLPANQISFCQTKYPMPTDYDRPVDNTQWDKSKHWQMLGPITQQQEEWLKSGFIATGPRIRWYIQGGTFQIWPALSSNEYLGFNYISKNWVYAAGDSLPTKALFTADTDTCIFPNELAVLMLKLTMFEIKGFDTTAIYRDYTDQKSIAFAYDQGSPVLSQAPTRASVLVTWNNIPDSGYGNP